MAKTQLVSHPNSFSKEMAKLNKLPEIQFNQINLSTIK